MAKRSRKRRKYAHSIHELEDDDNLVLYVGKINPQHLGGTIDLRKQSCHVILTGHRYNHYMRRHAEMSAYEGLLPSVLEHPDVVGRSKFPRAERLVFSRKIDWRYLSLVVEIRRKKRTHEVVSFFFEKERDIRRRRKEGLVIWEREQRKTTRPDRHPGIS